MFLKVKPKSTIDISLFLFSTFLQQEGFPGSDAFLYKFLTLWDGSLLRPQILGLLSNIPIVPSSRRFSLVLKNKRDFSLNVKTGRTNFIFLIFLVSGSEMSKLLFEPLTQLFFTSSLFFKVGFLGN